MNYELIMNVAIAVLGLVAVVVALTGMWAVIVGERARAFYGRLLFVCWCVASVAGYVGFRAMKAWQRTEGTHGTQGTEVRQ